MLSEREKHGVAELLTKMSLADLASLCQTVTSRQAPHSPQLSSSHSPVFTVHAQYYYNL